MTGTHPRGPLPMGEGPTRDGRVPNEPGGQDSLGGGAASTPINEDEGPRALRQLGSEIDKLWEGVETSHS
jgi:hypothetical protein